MATKMEETLDKPKEECHPAHSIEWRGPDNASYIITCNKAQTVENLLRQSPQFRKTAEKFKNKELVITMARRAISSHFPCSLVTNECLAVKYIKAAEQQKAAVGSSTRSLVKAPSNKVLMFHLLVKGRHKIVRIMTNLGMKTEVEEVTVFAYKGEKVKFALKRDGRFYGVVFKKTCALQNIHTDVITELSNLVDNLEGQTFQIILLSRSSPPESQPSIGEVLSASQQSDSSETCSQLPTTAQTKTENVPAVEPQTKGATATVMELIVLPGSREIRNHLQSQFRDIIKTKRNPVPPLSRVQNLFRVQYGQNDAMRNTVKRMKKLMTLSDSVCQVRSDGKALGSGFLLFGKFVLTNGHVVSRVYDGIAGRLIAPVTVHFSFEDLNDVQGGQFEVEELVGYELQPDAPRWDWALLKLRDEQKLPDGLLSHSGFLPRGGGICIIGHPSNTEKSIDTCLVVTPENRQQVVDKHCSENVQHVQLITSDFFKNVSNFVQENKMVLTYESCFYYGSSGSPVFDQDCRVVAMHTGGYVYTGRHGETQSVIEYGQSLCVILERIFVQTVETERFDVLKEFIEGSGLRPEDFVSFMAKMILKCDLAGFKKTVRCSFDNMKDESLKEIFKLALDEAEGVPMDTSVM